MSMLYRNFYSFLLISIIIPLVGAAKVPLPIYKHIPKGWAIEKTFSGFIDKGVERDYCILLKSKTGNDERPLLVCLNSKKFLFNDKIIFPFNYIGKYSDAFEKIRIEGNKIVIIQYVPKKNDVGASDYYLVFAYRQGKLSLFDVSIHDSSNSSKSKKLPFQKTLFKDFTYKAYN